jgi:hypothetical protein
MFEIEWPDNEVCHLGAEEEFTTKLKYHQSAAPTATTTTTTTTTTHAHRMGLN